MFTIVAEDGSIIQSNPTLVDCIQFMGWAVLFIIAAVIAIGIVITVGIVLFEIFSKIWDKISPEWNSLS